MQRVVMALHLEGLTPSEIASEINATRMQVSTNLSHAKEALKAFDANDRRRERS